MVGALSGEFAGKFLAGDNLPILSDMESNSVDLIYLDPPFNSARNYAGTEGSRSAGASFADVWRWADVDAARFDALCAARPVLARLVDLVGEAAGDAMRAYTAYMAGRIAELHRVLRPTGSLYLHSDPAASHYLKIVLDAVFGAEHFVNEIVWSYRTGGASARRFAQKHDVILLYAKTDDYYLDVGKEKSYTKSKGRKAGHANYGAGSAEFFEDAGGVYNFVNSRDVWEIPYINSQARERTGYPTQKPLALLERIIRASSRKGEVVLDPFCGSGTACVAAQKLGRRWIGIDKEVKAEGVLKERLDEL